MMAYDALNQRLVLFGGVSAGGALLDDTWLWNGTVWTSASPAVRPSPRRDGAMAFDRGRGLMVLFGGVDGSETPLDDTWEWNGSTWQLRALAVRPPARFGSSLAFDPVNGGVLLFGGIGPGAPPATIYADTWSFLGTSWLQRQPATPPAFRDHAGMASDLYRQRVVLVGGSSTDPFAWEWNGTQWSVTYQPTPAPRMWFGMSHDPGARRLVVYGGTVWLAGYWYSLDDTWIYRTPLPADVVPFGNGCVGTAGTPMLAAVPFAWPWLGDTMRNVVQAIPTGEPGAIFVSSFGSTPPVSLGSFGMPGCDLLVPMDVAEFRVAAASRAEWALAIPNSLALAGVAFRQQAFVFDAAANSGGLTASNAVTVTLGIR